MGALTRLRRDAPPATGETAASVALGVATIGAAIGLMACSAELIQRAALHPAVLSLSALIVGVRFFGISRGVFRYLERLVSHDAAFRLLARVRLRFFRALVPLSPGGLGAHRSGDLLRRVVDDVDSLQELYLRAVGPPVVAAAIGLLTVGLVGAFAPVAGLVAGVGLLVGGAVVPALALALGRGPGRQLVELRATITTEAVDALRAAPELALWGAADRVLDRIGELDAQARTAIAKVARRAAVLEVMATLAAGLTVVAVLLAGIAAVDAGHLDPVHLGLLALATMASFEAVAPLPAAFQTLDGVRAAAERLYELVDEPPPVPEPELPAALPSHPALRLQGVGVRHHREGPWALSDVDLDVGPGRRIAVVGPSGAGKTTLVDVLERFVPYTAGTVRAGGHLDADAEADEAAGEAADDEEVGVGVEVDELRSDDVRRWLALSGQDAHVFSGSVAANLRIGRPEATADELRAVLARVDLDDWVDQLPAGLDTELGDDAAQASGGQRQRLLLARALLRDAPVLVLDEPTSHLDDTTAEALVEDVLALTAQADGDGPRQGLVLVTHRYEGLDRMDEILVLHRGSVVERGTHAQLMAADGRYAASRRALAPPSA